MIRDSRIVRRLVAVTLAAGLLTGIIGVLLVQVLERRDHREAVTDQMIGLAERTATSIDGRIDALGSQLRLLSSTPGVADLSPEASTQLAIALRATQTLDSLTLYDGDGRAAAAASSSRLLRPPDLPGRDDLSVGTAPSGPPARIIWEGVVPSVELGTLVEDPPGTPAGTLVGIAPLVVLAHEVTAHLDGPSVNALVVGEDGSVIAHRELDRVLERRPFAIDEVVDGDRPATVLEIDGERMLVAAAPLRTVPAWVVVQRPEDGFLAAADAGTGEVTSVFLAVVIAIVAAVTIAGSRMLQPLRPLADAVERIGGGDTSVRTDLGGVGEVEVLAQGFNQMAERLERRRRELEHAEREARESEERLRLMVEGVEDYAILLLDLDGTILTWNTGARRLLGHATDEAIGRRLTASFDPTDPPADPLPLAVQQGRAEEEGWCRRADGDRFWAHIVVTALQDDVGDPYGYAVILHDLTTRRAAQHATEEALRREREAAAELRRANELKDEFLAIATHEIRTPLSAILGSGHVLWSDWEHLGDAERRELVEIVDRHAQDMGFIVDRLLDFTRLQAGRVRVNRVPIALDEEMHRHVELLGPQLDGHRLDVTAESVTVGVDRALMRHVVTNLLSNAAKFSPTGSTIALAASVVGDRLVIRVADEGVGIAPEEHQLIFELFRRSSNDAVVNARGTGVGLAIVKRYVELAEGSITVESAPGEGATFTVDVPVALDPDDD